MLEQKELSCDVRVLLQTHKDGHYVTAPSSKSIHRRKCTHFLNRKDVHICWNPAQDGGFPPCGVLAGWCLMPVVTSFVSESYVDQVGRRRGSNSDHAHASAQLPRTAIMLTTCPAQISNSTVPWNACICKVKQKKTNYNIYIIIFIIYF